MEQNQTPIICDTNIWYWIAEGHISAEDIAGKLLIGTYINAEELCSTPKAYKDYAKLRSVIDAFGKYYNGICIHPPVEYMKFVSDQPSSSTSWNLLSKTLGAALRIEDLGDAELTKEIFNNYDGVVRGLVQPFMDVIDQQRSNIKHRGSYKKNMNTPESRAEHKEEIKELMADATGIRNVRWDLLELFLSTFDEWVRQLMLQPNLKMKVNDWDDVLNLVYVRPGALYWTKDFKKTREFIINSGCGHYLL